MVSLLNDVETISYHVGDANPSQLAICVMGDFRGYGADPLEEAALRDVVAALDVVLRQQLPIRPHSSFRETECPARLTTLIEGLRTTVASDPYVIGAGVRQLMRETNDRPLSDEEYVNGELSLTMGEAGLYVWSKKANRVQRYGR